MRVALFGILAASGLCACETKTLPPIAGKSAFADSADQVIFGLRTTLTNQGVSRAQLHADTAYAFDDNTRYELENVHTTFYTTAGAKDGVLTSRHGTYNSRSSRMVARQDVVVVSEDGRRLTTEELIYNQQKNEISSDSAFVMTEPNRRLEGIGFRSDPNMQNIQILKGARGTARGISTEPAPAASSSPQR